jgi:hypothetical protein
MKAIDCTMQNVNLEVINKIENHMKESDDHILDFIDTEILRFTHKEIARFVLEYNVTLKNIPEALDQKRIEYHKMVFSKPGEDSLKKIIDMVKKSFVVGDLCILEKIVSKGNRRESIRKIAELDKYYPDGIVLKLYDSRKTQPGFSGEYERLENIKFDALYDGDVLINFPGNCSEQHELDAVYNGDYSQRNTEHVRIDMFCTITITAPLL